MRQRILLKAFLIKISSKPRTIEGNGTSPFTRSEGDGERPGQLTEHSYTRISPFKVQIMRGGGIGQSSETRENLDCWEIRKDCKITSIW